MTCKERKEIKENDTWDLRPLYANWEAWNKDFSSKSVEGFSKLSMKNQKLEDPAVLKGLLQEYFAVERALDKLFTYAHLKHDEDVGDEDSKKAQSHILHLIHNFREETSWIDPQLLQLTKEQEDALLCAEELQEYVVYLKKTFRMKHYTLDASMEKLLAAAQRALDTGQKAFSAFNNGDLHFESCVDAKGNHLELTHGTYHVYMKSPDRTLRKEAFCHMHNAFGAYQNTLCELLQGQVERHVFIQRTRGFASCLEAALYPHDITTDVYTTLITTTKAHSTSLQDYVMLRKKCLNVDALHVYDLSVPIVEDVTIEFSYEEATEAILTSVEILGDAYVDVLRKGLTTDRWVDRYENLRKRSGGFSSGCYDSHPYILMNYHGTLSDVMTLTHEAGHSMHSFLSRTHQPYQDHQYPIFLAEVASTLHEELLFHYLVEKSSSPKEKSYLLNQRIDAIRNTFFRQVLFAEFEAKIHDYVEHDTPLTPKVLQDLYLELNKEYFGSALVLDPELAFEWSRIPHFYYNFYVYQYATGISAAHVLAEKVRKKDVYARDSYLEFLASGSSLDPISTLRRAGVDMALSQPIEALLTTFQGLVQQLTQELTSVKN